MPLLSQLLGRPVLDVNGRRVGRLVDLVACAASDSPYPEVVSVVVKRGRSTLAVPLSSVALLDTPAIPLNKALSRLPPYEPRLVGFSLVRDVLGKEVRDSTRSRVMRVSDLGLMQFRSRLWVTAVQGSGSRMSRLRAAAQIFGMWPRLKRRPGEQLILWGAVEWASDDPALLDKLCPGLAGDGGPAREPPVPDGQASEQGELL